MSKKTVLSIRNVAIPEGYRRVCTLTAARGSTRILRRINDGEIFLQMYFKKQRRKHLIFANCKDLNLGIPILSIARITQRIAEVLRTNKGIPPVVAEDEYAPMSASTAALPQPTYAAAF